MLVSWLLLQSSALTGAFKSPRVTESSGVVVSHSHAGTLWTHNDSGDGPYLYATDSLGNDHGAIRVSGAEAIDWEDLASGPCPGGRAGATCLYIADTGDNLEQRKSVTIYAVLEPVPPRTAADTQRVTAAARALRLRYPDGSHDVEAIYVSPRDTAVYLMSKGRGGSVTLYRVARRAWSSESVVTAERVQTLPIVPSRRVGRMVTGAAVRADGAVVAIRTYVDVFFFQPERDGRLIPWGRPGCSIAGVDRAGEAIAFRDDSTLILTGEATTLGPGTVHTLRCP
jgi:hypothetical protein